MPTVAMWVQLAMKHPVPDQVKPSFVIFDIRALRRSERRSPPMPKITNGLAQDALYLYPGGNSRRHRVKGKGLSTRYSAAYMRRLVDSSALQSWK